MNRGLLAMGTHTHENPTSRVADPVAALRAVLALRPGAERVKSKTRRFAAAQALGLLSGDGWRAHHEKALADKLFDRDLADPNDPELARKIDTATADMLAYLHEHCRDRRSHPRGDLISRLAAVEADGEQLTDE